MMSWHLLPQLSGRRSKGPVKPLVIFVWGTIDAWKSLRHHQFIYSKHQLEPEMMLTLW